MNLVIVHNAVVDQETLAVPWDEQVFTLVKKK